MKNVFNFKSEFIIRNAMGDLWKGKGWVKGEVYIVQCIFFGCDKKERERTLKDLILKKAGKNDD